MAEEEGEERESSRTPVSLETVALMASSFPIRGWSLLALEGTSALPAQNFVASRQSSFPSLKYEFD